MTATGKFPGRIQGLPAKEGDRVKQDQILVQMDDTQTPGQTKARHALAVLDTQVRAAEMARFMLWFQGEREDLVFWNISQFQSILEFEKIKQEE